MSAMKRAARLSRPQSVNCGGSSSVTRTQQCLVLLNFDYMQFLFNHMAIFFNIIISKYFVGDDLTTGKLDFAECLRLCRVLFIGHSAKQYFPECRTRQRWLCRVPGTRQSLALGKTGFCRVPRHSAKVPLGKRWPARDGGHLPSDFAECLTDGTRQIFFYF